MPPVAAPPPHPARTTFTFVVGNYAVGAAPAFDVPEDSPIITSLTFLPWDVRPAGTPTRVSQSSLVGAILYGTRRPADDQLPLLRGLDFLGHELLASAACTFAHHLDLVGAFSEVYGTLEQWAAATSGLLAKMAAASLSAMRLAEAHFYATAPLSRAAQGEVGLLAKLSIGALVSADDELPASSYVAQALSRATILCGWKSSNDVRGDEDSDLRMVTDRLVRLLRRRMNDTDGSAGESALARELCCLLADPSLPLSFSRARLTSMHAMDELETTFNYWNGSAATTRSIEASRFLGVSKEFKNVGSVVSLFTSPSTAWIEVERLAAALLPSGMSSLSTLARLSQMEQVLGTASWQAIITSLKNDTPTISGTELVTALVVSHVDLDGSATSSGVVNGSGAPIDTLLGASHGSVRDTSVADALRQSVATVALAEAAGQSGVERVETMMLSGSTILLRAIFLQESWLQNKAASLSFCSLEAPSLCPFFASALTEEGEGGEIPTHLKGFVYPEAQLDILRSGKWSALSFINGSGGQLEIERLGGATWMDVDPSEQFIVAICLTWVKTYGTRLFAALSFDAEPQDGYSFADLVDKMIQAVSRAHSLPPAERAEWQTFLNSNFCTALDLAGQLFLAKVRSARPENAESVVGCFLPLENSFWTNVDARLETAKPLVQLRAAFPTMFAAEKVVVPGTSSSPKPFVPGSPGGDGSNAGKGSKAGVKRQPDQQEGPGCKSHYCKVLSPTALFYCGTVIKTDEVQAYCDVSGLCLPVVLSKKKGDEALELCPNHQTHGGIKSKAHTRPKGLDIDHVFKNFTRKPTQAEYKATSWVALKRGKQKA